MMQKRVVVSFRGGNTNDDDESVMACGGVMFSFNNARWPIGIGTGAVEGHATSGRSSEKHAVFKKEGRTALHGELFLRLAREYDPSNRPLSSRAGYCDCDVQERFLTKKINQASGLNL